MPQRIAFIDIAKGIGILLVVLAHNDLQAYAPFVHQFIYAFHMPLFFFLSGMFFKPEIGFVELLKKRFNSLLMPYFFTIFLIYFFEIFLGKMGLPIAWSRITKSFYGNGFFLDWVAMWFLPALFMMNLVAFGFYRLLGRFASPWPRWLALALMQTVGVLTLDTFLSFNLNLLGRSLPLQGLPFSLDLALVGGFFFVLGREIYRNVPQEWFGSWWVLLGSTVLLLGLTWFFPATIDLNIRSWDAPLLNTLEALLGIVLVLALSWQLARGPAWLVSFFSYMGRISVLILIFHNPVQSYLTGKLDLLIGGNLYTPLLVYPFAVLVPVLIYEIGVKPNPLTTRLFGMKAAQRQDSAQIEDRVFTK
jgi:polysaccharide biosynthesis protein PslL